MVTSLEHFARDLQFAARNLVRTPGFSALAIASLAVGIMSATAMYSVLHAVVLDPFPYKDVDRLMSVRIVNTAQRGGRLNYTVDQFLEIAERNTIFEGTIASTISDVLWSGEGDPQRLRGNHGPFNTFDVMGVRPLIGRTPDASDARPGAPPVAVLGYRFWQRQFGGDPKVVGRQMRLNDNVRTVIGVMPKRFMWRGADVYLPMRFERGRVIEGVRNVHLLGRLKPNITEAQAEADLRPIVQDLKQREPAAFPDAWRVTLLSFKDTFPSGITGDIWVLFGAVSLLLVIACANVSNLLLSRAAARQREMSVRAALGANRSRIVQQLLTESLLLALLAGAAGTALAYVGLPLILALVPPDTIPDESEVTVNSAVLIFTLFVCAVTSVVCGLAPALHSSRRDLAVALREAGRSLAGGSRQALLRKTLVVAEVALALMLLAGSSLLIRTFLSLKQVDLGYTPDRFLTLRVPLSIERYPDASRRTAFYQDLLDRIRTVPGVAAVGLNSGLHPLGNMWSAVEISGTPPITDPVVVDQVDAGYAGTMGLRLVAGRLLTDDDVRGVRPVAVVNERFVRARLNGQPPLGQSVRVSRLAQPPFNMKLPQFDIVGIVGDTLNDGLSRPVLPEVYVPFTTAGIANWIVIRANVEPASLTRAVSTQVYAIDRNQPVASVMTLDNLLKEEEFARPRFNLALLTVFGGIGLVLAVIGVYGVMSNAVAQQRQEIGVRMALGASSSAIARMIVASGSRMLSVGLLLGLGGSVVLTKLLAHKVWNISELDPIAFALVTLIVLAAGIQACVWPAWRASRIDPLVALREE